MSEDIKDRIKSFVLGIGLPLVLVCSAVQYMTGHWTTTRHGMPLTPREALGDGLWIFGMALCAHAFFYQRYDNHPGIKGVVIILGLFLFLSGLYLHFG